MSSIDHNGLFGQNYQKEYDFNTSFLSLNEIVSDSYSIMIQLQYHIIIYYVFPGRRIFAGADYKEWISQGGLAESD